MPVVYSRTEHVALTLLLDIPSYAAVRARTVRRRSGPANGATPYSYPTLQMHPTMAFGGSACSLPRPHLSANQRHHKLTLMQPWPHMRDWPGRPPFQSLPLRLSCSLHRLLLAAAVAPWSWRW